MEKVYPLRADNKIIIITGGYGHLGKAITNSLLFHGATVIVAGKNENKFNETFPAKNENLLFIECDISFTEAVQNLFSFVYSKFGRIDILINNAIFTSGKSPDKMTDEDWAYGIDGTLGTTFRCIREILPFFRKAGCGNIINVSSMYGIVAPDFGIYDESPSFISPPHYGAAKAGVLQLTRYYASYLSKDNVTVNAVTPGPFPSPEVQKDKRFIKRLSSKNLAGRIGQPEDLAGIFTFLSSDASHFITGQNFIVDGGWTTR